MKMVLPTKAEMVRAQDRLLREREDFIRSKIEPLKTGDSATWDLPSWAVEKYLDIVASVLMAARVTPLHHYTATIEGGKITVTRVI